MAILKRSSPQKKEYPFVPLRDLIIFPHMVVPLLVGRQRSINSVEEAMSLDNLLVIAFQRSAQVEEPALEQLYETAVLVKVIQSVRESDGTMKVLVESLDRVKITSVVPQKKFFCSVVEPIKTVVSKDKETEALKRFLLELVEKYLKISSLPSKEFYGNLMSIEEASQLVDSITGYLPLKLKDKARILETLDEKERLKALIEIVNAENGVLEVQKEIQDKLLKRIEQTQKEYLLTEQMKTIQQELGKDTESHEIGQLKEKILAAKMTKEAETKALEELSRLSKTMPMSPEATVIRTYLDWLITLPWSQKTEDNLDIVAAHKILEEDHYGLDKAKERILEYLAVRKKTDSLKGPILCFVGPPGVGKTSLGKSISRCVGRKFVRISLGGMRDEAEIRGHRRTYIGALPGRIVQSLRKAGVNNPVLLLDEIDKLGTDFRGDPASALLEVLDPEQNHAFSDHYLEVSFDLSKVLFITTANTEFSIPPPLLDRMEVIPLSGYTAWEKTNIARKFLLPRLFKEHGLSSKTVKISDATINAIIKDYTREAGVRNLERELARVLRKITRTIVEGKEKKKSFTVTVPSLRNYLGPQQYTSLELERKAKVGVATGMAWTEYGGDILYTEAVLMKGKGNLTLTGKLGDVMKESAQAALSYVRSNCASYGIAPNFYEQYDIHIHVPEGAIPKDGPSAGVTIVTAMVSALTGRKVRSDLAMTGEITLHGNVLGIGGLKSKILAAHRSGIRTVLIPKENEKDLTEIPELVRAEMEIISVDRVSRILDLALESSSKSD